MEKLVVKIATFDGHGQPKFDNPAEIPTKTFTDIEQIKNYLLAESISSPKIKIFDCKKQRDIPLPLIQNAKSLKDVIDFDPQKAQQAALEAQQQQLMGTAGDDIAKLNKELAAANKALEEQGIEMPKLKTIAEENVNCCSVPIPTLNTLDNCPNSVHVKNQHIAQEIINKPIQVKEKIFKRGDQKFKLVGDKLFMWDWIEPEEARLFNKDQNITEEINTEQIIQIKDWVEVVDEEENSCNNTEQEQS